MANAGLFDVCRLGVVATGGATGWGLASAEALADKGARVTVFGGTPDDIKGLALLQASRWRKACAMVEEGAAIVADVDTALSSGLADKAGSRNLPDERTQR